MGSSHLYVGARGHLEWALQRFLTAAPWTFEPAILANAASLIAVHCHPSGSRDRFVPR